MENHSKWWHYLWHTLDIHTRYTRTIARAGIVRTSPLLYVQLCVQAQTGVVSPTPALGAINLATCCVANRCQAWNVQPQKEKWLRPYAGHSTNKVQSISFWFDYPGMPHLQCRRFSCRSWAPLTGDGDDIITVFAWVAMNGIAQTCFSGRAKGKFLIQGELPFNSKPRALVGFELRTEPELSTGDSHSTSAPLQFVFCCFTLVWNQPSLGYLLQC